LSFELLRLGCEARGVRGVKPVVQEVWGPNYHVPTSFPWNSNLLFLFLFQNLNFCSIDWRWLRSIPYYINRSF